MSDILDLDALIGQSKTLRVRVGGQEYALKHADALTPPEFARLMRLGKSLQNAQDESQLESALGALDEFLQTVGGEWALSLPMRAKFAIIQFWGEQTGAAPKN